MSNDELIDTLHFLKKCNGYLTAKEREAISWCVAKLYKEQRVEKQKRGCPHLTSTVTYTCASCGETIHGQLPRVERLEEQIKDLCAEVVRLEAKITELENGKKEESIS